MGGKTSNQAKLRWNADHYSQIKISVPIDLATAFKAKCLADGLSITGVLSRFMRDFTDAPIPVMPASDPFSTKPLRRKALATLSSQLSDILAAEQRYLDNIPANLQSSHFYDSADHAVSALEDALISLDAAY